MEKISNDTLTLLLIIAIVVSVGSTIISINRINQLIPRATGLATDTSTGLVNISLAFVNSISISDDNQIDFGSCIPNASTGSNLSSNISNSTGSGWASWGVTGTCTDFESPDNITIRNDGNSNVNLSVKVGTLASEFVGGSDPSAAQMFFSVRNATDQPGCFNASLYLTPDDFEEFDPTTGMQWKWKHFDTADQNYLACANLTPTKNVNSIYVFIKLFIPADAPVATSKNTTLTFTATNW